MLNVKFTEYEYYYSNIKQYHFSQEINAKTTFRREKMYHAQIVQEHEGRMQMQQNVNGDL